MLSVRIFCREQREILGKKMMIGEERKNSHSMREGEKGQVIESLIFLYFLLFSLSLAVGNLKAE